MNTRRNLFINFPTFGVLLQPKTLLYYIGPYSKACLQRELPKTDELKKASLRLSLHILDPVQTSPEDAIALLCGSPGRRPFSQRGEPATVCQLHLT